MRILLVHPGPAFSVADVFRGWYKALQQLGHQVAVYNTDDRLTFYKNAVVSGAKLTPEQVQQLALQGLTSACYEFWPEVVLCVGGFYIPSERLQLFRARGHKVVVLHTESPYEDTRQLAIAPYADLNLINDPVNIGQYKSVASVAYMPHAYDPSIHYPGSLCRDYDLTFVGTAMDARQRFLSKLNLEGLRVYLGGSRWNLLNPEHANLTQHIGHHPEMSLDNADAADIYRQSRAGINIYRLEGEEGYLDGWAMGPREVEMAACGLPYLRDPRGENEETLPFLPSYASPEEASEQLQWLLSDEARREDLGRRAAEAVEDRTFLENAKFFSELMELANTC
jgi:spore maturation protein CgeB